MLTQKVTNSWSSNGVSRKVQNVDSRRAVDNHAHAFGVFVFNSGMWKEGEGVNFEGGATNA